MQCAASNSDPKPVIRWFLVIIGSYCEKFKRTDKLICRGPFQVSVISLGNQTSFSHKTWPKARFKWVKIIHLIQEFQIQGRACVPVIALLCLEGIIFCRWRFAHQIQLCNSRSQKIAFCATPYIVQHGDHVMGINLFLRERTYPSFVLTSQVTLTRQSISMLSMYECVYAGEVLNKCSDMSCGTHCHRIFARKIMVILEDEEELDVFIPLGQTLGHIPGSSDCIICCLSPKQTKPCLCLYFGVHYPPSVHTKLLSLFAQ